MLFSRFIYILKNVILLILLFKNLSIIIPEMELLIKNLIKLSSIDLKISEKILKKEQEFIILNNKLIFINLNTNSHIILDNANIFRSNFSSEDFKKICYILKTNHFAHINNYITHTPINLIKLGITYDNLLVNLTRDMTIHDIYTNRRGG